jgi:hypothetical protein
MNKMASIVHLLECTEGFHVINRKNARFLIKFRGEDRPGPAGDLVQYRVCHGRFQTSGRYGLTSKTLGLQLVQRDQG